MELKTKINAEEGKQDLLITREFDLPLELLFKAFTDAELIGQWMGTKVLKLENKKHGSWQFESTSPNGNKVVKMGGAIHDVIPNQKIIRTFEMENTSFGVQLEITEFVKLTEGTSKINMHTIYESVAQRDEVLKLPFAQGTNWAHNRLEELLKTLK